MKRIIMHWTAGTYTPNNVDKKAYHKLIDGDGNVHNGTFPISANQAPLSKGGYAAHTLNCNTDSIGVAVCAMAGAVEAPFKSGSYPITRKQEEALVALVRSLAAQYNIPITNKTILTHAEVQTNLGIAQKNKWDITYLPSLGKTTAKAVGDHLRKQIAGQSFQPAPILTKPQPTFWEWIKSILSR